MFWTFAENYLLSSVSSDSHQRIFLSLFFNNKELSIIINIVYICIKMEETFLCLENVGKKDYVKNKTKCP